MTFDNSTSKNFQYSTIAVAPQTPLDGLTLSVQPTDGVKFAEAPFWAVACAPETQPLGTNAEIIRVTGKAGDKFTIERAQQGSVAQAIGTGWNIFAGDTAQSWLEVHTAIETNATAISAETTRAEAAEAANTTAITTEVAARKTAVTGAEAAATAATKTEEEARKAEVKTEKERAEAAEGLKAPLANPVLTGTPKAPTAPAKTNTEQLATTAFAQTAKTEAEAAAVPASSKGKANGVAELDGEGHVPAGELSASVVNGSAAGTLVAASAIYVLGTPTGEAAHDNKLIEEAIGKYGLPAGGTIMLGGGIWALTLKLGSTSEGFNYRIVGAGTYETILVPGSSTEPLLTIAGPGTTASEYFEMSDLSVCLPADRNDANPLVEILLQKGMLNIKPSVRFYSGEPTNPRGAVVSHTGTMLKLDGAYEGRVEAMFSTGKYAVPGEVVNLTTLPSAGVPPNMDTLKIGGPIYGAMGWIFRDAYDGNIGANGVNGVDFDGYKLTSTVFYPTPPACEATLAKEAKPGDPTLTLTTACVFPAAGKTKVAENLEVGDLVTIGKGNVVECKKITAITEEGAETVLKLSQPIRFVHPSGATAPTAIKGGKGVSIGNGYSGLTWTAFHFEGPWIGISADRVSGMKLISGRAAVGEIVRAEGETQGVEFGVIQSQGTPNRHVRMNKPPYNKTEAGRWGGHLALASPIAPLGLTFTGKTTSASKIVTEVSNTEGLEVGQKIMQTVFPVGTTIEKITGTELELSQNATESGAGKTFTALPSWYIEPTIFNFTGTDYIWRRTSMTGGGQYTTTLVFNNAGTGGKVLAQTPAWEVQSNGTPKASCTFEGTTLVNGLAMAQANSAEASVTLTRTSPGYCGVGGSGARTRKLPLGSEIEEGRIYIFKDQGRNAAAGNITVEAQAPDKLEGTEKGTTVINTNGGVVRLYWAGAAIGWLLI